MRPEALTDTLAAAIAKIEEQPLPALKTGEEAGVLVKATCNTDAVFLLLTLGPTVKYNLSYAKYSAFLHIQSKNIPLIPQTDWAHCSRREDLGEILREFNIMLRNFSLDSHNGAAFDDAETMAVCVNNPFAKPAHSEPEDIKGVEEHSDWFLLSA